MREGLLVEYNSDYRAAIGVVFTEIGAALQRTWSHHADQDSRNARVQLQISATILQMVYPVSYLFLGLKDCIKLGRLAQYTSRAAVSDIAVC